MSSVDSPAAEVDVTSDLVGELIRQQHPDLGHLPVSFLSEGWDNAQFRLGDELIARLPRRQLSVRLIEHEQAWLGTLAPLVPLPVPVAERIGEPSPAFAWPWSICRWIPGTDAITTPVRGSSAAASQIAEFLNALHQPAPSNAPENPHRGGPLGERDNRTRACADAALAAGRLSEPEHARVLEAWSQALAAAAFAGSPVWLHGDLHPGNIATEDGSVTGILDWGDLTSGDPACDFGVLWGLFDGARRAEALHALNRDTATVARAHGWALSIGVLLMTHSEDRPSYAALGRQYIEEVLAS